MNRKVLIKTNHNIRNKKGMTLVEVIVAMVIAVIVVGATGSLLVSSTNFFNNTASRAENERIASTILNFAMSELRFAKDISVDSISSNPPNPVVGRGLIYMMDSSGRRAEKGMVGYKRPFDPDKARNIYGESFYNGRKVGIRMQPLDVDQPKVIRLFVDIYDKNDKLVYTDSGTLEVPNIPYDKPPTRKMDDVPTNCVLFDYEALPDRTPDEPKP